MSALVFGGRLNWLKAAWTHGLVIPLVSRASVTELLRIMSYSKFQLTFEERKTLLTLYLPYADIVDLPDPLPALPVNCRDKSDEVFLHLAIAGKATFLVTGDADLLAMRAAAPVTILTIAELRTRLE